MIIAKCLYTVQNANCEALIACQFSELC